MLDDVCRRTRSCIHARCGSSKRKHGKFRDLTTNCVDGARAIGQFESDDGHDVVQEHHGENMKCICTSPSSVCALLTTLSLALACSSGSDSPNANDTNGSGGAAGSAAGSNAGGSSAGGASGADGG